MFSVAKWIWAVNFFVFGIILLISFARAAVFEQCPSVTSITADEQFSFDNDGENWKIKTDNGYLYLRENRELCTFYLVTYFPLNGVPVGLDFVNKYNRDNFFGKLVKMDDSIMLESYFIIPDAPSQVLRIQLRLFKHKADQLMLQLARKAASMKPENTAITAL